MFRYLEALGVTQECDRRMERRTDILLANAAFNYVNCAANNSVLQVAFRTSCQFGEQR